MIAAIVSIENTIDRTASDIQDYPLMMVIGEWEALILLDFVDLSCIVVVLVVIVIPAVLWSDLNEICWSSHN